MKARSNCYACDDDLVKESFREGKYLCLSCQRFGKRVFVVAVALGGFAGGLLVKVLTKLGWL